MAETNKRAEQKQATRLRLLAASRRLFADQGILATRTLEVATAAKVAHGTIFAHFSTREDLVTAVVDEYAGRTAKELGKLGGGGVGLREVLAAHLAGLSEQEDFYARLVMEGSALPAIARQRFHDIQATISSVFTEAAAREKAAGKIHFSDVAMLFDTWLGLIHHYVCNRDLFAHANRPVLADRGPELLEHFLLLIEKETP